MSVTTDELARKLSGLHEEVASVKAQIFEAIRTFYAGAPTTSSGMSLDEAIEFAGSWSRKVDLRSSLTDLPASEIQLRMARLEAVLTDTVAQLQHDDNDDDSGTLHQSVVAHERVSVQIQQSQSTLSLLQLLSDVDTALQSFDLAMDVPDLTRAATDLAAIETCLSKMNAQHPTASMEYRIVQIMQMQYEARLNQLQCYLADTISGLWKISPRSMSITPTSMPVYDTLQRTRQLTAHLEQLAADLYEHIFAPLFADASLVPTVRQSIVTLTPKTAASTGIARVQHLCAHVITLLKFLAPFLPPLESEASVLAMLMPLLWSSALEAAFVSLLQSTLPPDAAQLRDFKQHLTPVMHSFEASLVALRLALPASLVSFGQHLDVQFAEHKRAILLQEARERMQHDYLNSVLVPSYPAVLVPTNHKKKTVHASPMGTDEDDDRSTPMRVSVCAQWLVAQVDQLLAETSECDVAGPLLLQTARDLFALFSALMPTLYKEELRFDPRLVLLLHNDAMYFTRHMLTLCDKSRLPSSLHDSATMIDLVPDLRDLGETKLVAFAKAHATQLEDALRSAFVVHFFAPYASLDDDDAFNQLETAIKSVVFKLERIVHAWKGGLAPLDVYCRMVANLLEPLLRFLLNALLVSPSPAAVVVLPPKAVHQLHYLFSLLLHCDSFFPSTALVCKYVRSAKAFHVVTTLLEENSVSGIIEQWNAGTLADVTRPQLVLLLQNLTGDATDRASALAP